MPKRAERRHHEERIKDKFRRVAKRWAGSLGQWTNKWRTKWSPEGRLISREGYIDRSGGARRMQFIEDTAVRSAHHSSCDCGHCQRWKSLKREERKRERVLDKTYIEEGKEDANGREE